METKDIQTIVNEKISSMLDGGIIEKSIEETIENGIIKSITSAVGDYEIERLIKDKLKSEISTQLSDLSFTQYTNKIIESVCNIIKIESNKDLTERVKSFYGKIFDSDIKEVSFSKISDEYVEFMTSKKEEDYSEFSDYCKVSVEYDEQYDWYKIKFTVETNNYSSYSSSRKSEDNEYYYELTLSKSHDEQFKDKYEILSVYGSDRKSMTGRFSYRLYSEFEQFILGLYLSRAKISISEDDIGEEEYSLGDW